VLPFPSENVRTGCRHARRQPEQQSDDDPACGSTCAAATEWSGACSAVYKAALASGPPGTLIQLLGDPRSQSASRMNNTFQCDVDAHCPCGAGAGAKK
jgi:hypothetical protein